MIPVAPSLALFRFFGSLSLRNTSYDTFQYRTQGIY